MKKRTFFPIVIEVYVVVELLLLDRHVYLFTPLTQWYSDLFQLLRLCVASMNHGYVTLSFLLFCPFIITPSYSHKCHNDIITFVTLMSWCKNWFEPRTPTVMLIRWFDRPERIVFGHKVYTTRREVVFVQPDWLAMMGKFFSKLGSWRDKIALREFSFRPCFWCIDRNTVIFRYLCGIYENNYLPRSRKKWWIFTSPLQ